MSPLSIRIMTALFTCALGLTLAACWLVFFEPDAKNNELRTWLVENVPVFSGLPKPSDSFRQGTTQAHEDIGHGRYKIVIHGTQSPGEIIYRKALAKEYGVEVEHLGCCTSNQQNDFADGYNQVAEAAIKEKYGRYFFDNIKYHAEQLAAFQEEQIKNLPNRNFSSVNNRNISRVSHLVKN